MGLLSAVLIAEEETDGVDDGAAEVLDAADVCSRLRVEALSSPSVMIGQDLLGTARTLKELVGKGDDGVVEGGAPARSDMEEAERSLLMSEVKSWSRKA